MADVTTTFAAKDESFAKTVGKLQGRLTEFSGGVSSFNSKVSGMAASFAKFAVPIAGVAAAFFGAKAAADAFGNALALGGRLDDLTKRTGASAGEMLLLEKAFDLAGSSAEAVGPTISKLNRFLAESSVAGSTQDETLQRLGLTYEQLAEQSPSEQMRILAERIAAIKNPAMKTQAAMLVFGKTGGDLIPLLSDFSGELDKARGFLGSLPEIMTENAAAFANLDDNITEIRKKFDQFVAGLITGLVPSLTIVTDQIANLDAAGFGRALSDIFTRTIEWTGATLGLGKALANVKIAIDGIMSGNFAAGLKLMFLTAQETAMRTINQIVASAQAALQSIAAAIGFIFRRNSVTMGLIEEAAKFMGATIASNISSQLNAVLKAFVTSIPQALRPLADFMADSFLPTISLVGKGLQGVLDGLDTSSFTNKLDEVTTGLDKTARSSAATFQGLLGPVADELATAFANIPKSFAESYTANMKNPLIDMREITGKTADEAERLQRAVRAAAFNAKEFGEAMEKSRVEGFADKGKQPPFMQQSPGTHVDEFGKTRPGPRFPHQGALPPASEFEPLPEAGPTGKQTAPKEHGMKDVVAKSAAVLDQSIEKMREAHHFGQLTHEEMYKNMERGGQSIYDATKNAGKDFAAQSQLSTDMRKIENKAQGIHGARERAYDRAARAQERGHDTSANNMRRRADEKFREEAEKLAPKAEKGAEEARKQLEKAGLQSGGDLKSGGKDAKDAMKDGAKAIEDATQGGGGGGGGTSNPVADVLDTIKTFLNTTFDDFKKRVPQNAMS